MSHTKGPWSIKNGIDVYDSDSYLVCEVNGLEDDARLIAAAPELLEALINFKNCSGNDPVAVAQVIEFAERAIAKATGKD